MAEKDLVVPYGWCRRRWHWWDFAFLAAAAVLVAFLVWSFVQPVWGIYDVHFGR